MSADSADIHTYIHTYTYIYSPIVVPLVFEHFGRWGKSHGLLEGLVGKTNSDVCGLQELSS